MFDYREWETAGYDQPEGNDRFWHPAEILSVRGHGSDRVASIRFEHDGRVSGGHFINAMEVIKEEQS